MMRGFESLLPNTYFKYSKECFYDNVKYKQYSYSIMKIYFAGSIRGGRDDQELYLSIISTLSQYGTVLTEHIGNKSLSNLGEQVVTNEFIFERDIEWVEEADVIVAEVTTPSLGVGYEIGHAISLDKKVLCIYREIEGKRLSAMIAGNKKLKIEKYNSIGDAEDILKSFFNSLGT